MINTITNKLAVLKRAMRRIQSRRHTERTLNDLTDYELNDIGLCRGDIRHVARGRKVYRKTY